MTISETEVPEFDPPPPSVPFRATFICPVAVPNGACGLFYVHGGDKHAAGCKLSLRVVEMMKDGSLPMRDGQGAPWDGHLLVTRYQHEAGAFISNRDGVLLDANPISVVQITDKDNWSKMVLRDIGVWSDYDSKKLGARVYPKLKGFDDE